MMAVTHLFACRLHDSAAGMEHPIASIALLHAPSKTDMHLIIKKENETKGKKDTPQTLTQTNRDNMHTLVYYKKRS